MACPLCRAPGQLSWLSSRPSPGARQKDTRDWLEEMHKRLGSLDKGTNTDDDDERLSEQRDMRNQMHTATTFPHDCTTCTHNTHTSHVKIEKHSVCPALDVPFSRRILAHVAAQTQVWLAGPATSLGFGYVVPQIPVPIAQ